MSKHENGSEKKCRQSVVKLKRWFKHLLFVLLVPFLIVTLYILYALTGYPDNWDKISEGMARDEVHAICGQPDIEGWDTKGDRWFDRAFFLQWELVYDMNVHTNVCFLKDANGIYTTCIHIKVNQSFRQGIVDEICRGIAHIHECK